MCYRLCIVVHLSLWSASGLVTFVVYILFIIESMANMKIVLLVCLVSLVAFSSAKLVGGLSKERPVDDKVIRYLFIHYSTMMLLFLYDI